MVEIIGKNPNITDWYGVCDVLRAINLERVQPANLKGQFVAYMTRPVCNEDVTAIIYGALEARCLEKAGVWRKYGEYVLPRPRYIIKREGEQDLHTNGLPFEMIWSDPGHLELFLRANTSDEFQSFLAVPYFIRDVVDKGWSKKSPKHSTFLWFHLAKEDLEKDSAVLGVHDEGLHIYKTEVDGVQVFTEEEVDRLLNLGKKKG